MIVNTLMPIFILIGLVAAGNFLWEFMAGRLRGPVQNVTSALEVLREEASSARLTIIAVTAEVSENISTAKTKLDIATAGVAKATDQIDATVTPIANFEVPIAGSPKLKERKPTLRNPIPYEVKMSVKRVKPFRELGKPFASLAAATTQTLNASADIKKTVEALKKLSPLADIFGEYRNKFDALAQQIKTVVDNFSKLGGSIAFLIKILAVTLLPWLALSYAFWGYRRLSVGWSLLRGKS